MASKLTLSMDEELIRFAHELAREKNESISNMVAAYFLSLKKKRFDPSELHPDVRKMLGAFKGSSIPKSKKEMRERYHRAKAGL
jgi:hypothetical protein